MAAGCFTWWTNMRRVRDDLERRIVDAIMCEAWLVLCKMMRWWISSVASTNYEYLSSYLSKEWFPRPERDKSTQRLELLVSKRSCAKKKKKDFVGFPATPSRLCIDSCCLLAGPSHLYSYSYWCIWRIQDEMYYCVGSRCG